MNKLNWEIAALTFVLAGCGGKTGKPVYQTDAIMSEPVVESATLDTVAAELETEENSQVIALVPNLASDKPLVMDEETKTEYLAPQWDPGDLWDEDGTISYDVNIGSGGRHLQALHEDLPGTPISRDEAGRLILIDLNQNGYNDMLVCLGRYGEEKQLLYDAYIWNRGKGLFTRIEQFRTIPNPKINTKSQHILSGDNEWEIEKDKLKKL